MESYRIEMDGDWNLEDLYVLPRTYIDLYSFLYSFTIAVDQYDDQDNRLVITYSAHPWVGGYSSLNFYSNLKYIVPSENRPSITSIQYASPGWMELSVVVLVATNLQRIVKCFVESGIELNRLYSDIRKGLHDREMMKIEAKRASLELEKEQRDFAIESAEKLSALLGFEHIAELHKLTGNPLASLKILLSFYRKIKILAKYETSGKAKF